VLPSKFADAMKTPGTAKTWQENIEQLKQGVRGRGNAVRYSPEIIRIAMAIYMRSPSALEALRGFNVLPLPSERTLRRYATTSSHPSGFSPELHLQFVLSRERFRIHWLQRFGNEVPRLKDCMLIYDEIKIVAGVSYNTADNSIIGFADDMSKLDNIFKNPSTMDDPSDDGTTKYILQSLLR